MSLNRLQDGGSQSLADGRWDSVRNLIDLLAQISDQMIVNWEALKQHRFKDA